MSLRKISFIGALAVAGAMFAGAAHAGGVNWSVNINVPGRAVYSEPAYYAPPATYYEPAPVYYTPPPTYYRPPVVVYRPGPVIVGGSWARHHHHHPHWREDRRGRDHYGRR